MQKEYVIVPSTLIHILTPLTHMKMLLKKTSKNVKVVQRVDLIRLKR